MPVAARSHRKAGVRSDERIDVRLRAEQKRCIERAAHIKGLSITDFIVQNAVDNAMRTIRDEEIWNLQRPDAAFFVQTLLHPPAPGKRLRAAAKRYKEAISR